MISGELFDNLARIARLNFSESEKSEVIKDMETILTLFSQQLVREPVKDLNFVEPLVHIHDLKNIFRDDIKEESLNREAVLAISPDSDREYFKIPRTFE